MTQEEKARAYDEALGQAKKELATCGSMDCDAARQIFRFFPELRESEDEEIRKELIGALMWQRDCLDAKGPHDNELILPGFTMKVGDILAWLEKQKEQKPILEVFGFKVGDAVRLKDGDGRKHIIKSFEEVEGLHGPNFYHVEFEDNLARDGIYPGEEYPNGYYTQMEKIEEEQKAADLSEMMVHKEPYIAPVPTPMVADEQKPAECEDCAMYLSGNCIHPNGKCENVKSKQEWSEEDKRKLNRIYEILGQAADEKPFGSSKRIIGDKEAVELQDFIKLLRPSWKPSEEEMKALKECGECKRCIKKLYEDLQKRYGTC